MASPATRTNRLKRLWPALAAAIFAVLAIIGATEAYKAGDPAGAANWILFGSAGVLCEVLKAQSARMQSVPALIVYCSAFFLWMISFIALVVWNLTGSYPVILFYAGVFAPWLALTAYVVHEARRAKMPTGTQ